MRVLLVHPNPLMYSELFLRLEPLGMERVAAAVRAAGHDIRLLDLQIFTHADLRRELDAFRPQAVGFSVNYLANVPEVVDLAKETRRRHKYFIGVLDPCASAEFTRGCPWDCSFCSAWTFYGRSYRKASPEAAAEDVARIREPNVFLVDVLIKNREVFAYWKRLGPHYMFLGVEALDAEALKAHRKRSTPNEHFEALEIARELGITVAINIIADPSWDERRFAAIRDWALTVPEVVHVTVATPYPGTETWLTEGRQLATRDYRLFDVQHAVLPTTLPLKRFYEELVKTQSVINRKHLGWSAARGCAKQVTRLLLRGQTNFARMIWNFSSVYNPDRQYGDHFQPVTYEMRPPKPLAAVERA